MALMLPPRSYLLWQQWVTLYQFWIHTTVVRRLVEYVFVTPSHHRMHHDSRLHKNFAGVFVSFGTACLLELVMLRDLYSHGKRLAIRLRWAEVRRSLGLPLKRPAYHWRTTRGPITWQRKSCCLLKVPF
jgi:sterol desaturase/sphingolipid hydroxylase (fatty acid hydroxylase superfamily)